MGNLHAYPFTEGEDFIQKMVERTIQQYANFDTPRMGAEVRKRLKLYAYNTSRDIHALCTQNGYNRVIIYFTATAPNGRKYESEREIKVKLR